MESCGDWFIPHDLGLSNVSAVWSWVKMAWTDFGPYEKCPLDDVKLVLVRDREVEVPMDELAVLLDLCLDCKSTSLDEDEKIARFLEKHKGFENQWNADPVWPMDKRWAGH